MSHYRLNIGGKVIAANMALNAGAKNFIPGKQWMKPKRVSWNDIGVTAVKYFDYTEGAQARMKGEFSALKGPPGSSIKDSNPDEAQPFSIPSLRAAQKIQKISQDKQKILGFPRLDISDVVNPTMDMQELRQAYLSCCQTPRLARTQPDRFNYCDN